MIDGIFISSLMIGCKIFVLFLGEIFVMNIVVLIVNGVVIIVDKKVIINEFVIIGNVFIMGFLFVFIWFGF